MASKNVSAQITANAAACSCPRGEDSMSIRHPPAEDDVYNAPDLRMRKEKDSWAWQSFPHPCSSRQRRPAAPPAIRECPPFPAQAMRPVGDSLNVASSPVPWSRYFARRIITISNPPPAAPSVDVAKSSSGSTFHDAHTHRRHTVQQRTSRELYTSASTSPPPRQRHINGSRDRRRRPAYPPSACQHIAIHPDVGGDPHFPCQAPTSLRDRDYPLESPCERRQSCCPSNIRCFRCNGEYGAIESLP